MLKKAMVIALLTVFSIYITACSSKDVHKQGANQVLSMIYVNEEAGEITQLYNHIASQESEAGIDAAENEYVAYLYQQYKPYLTDSCFENLMKIRKLSYYSIASMENGYCISIDAVSVKARDNGDYDISLNVIIEDNQKEKQVFPVTGSAQFDIDTDKISYLRLDDELVYLYTTEE